MGHDVDENVGMLGPVGDGEDEGSGGGDYGGEIKEVDDECDGNGKDAMIVHCDVDGDKDGDDDMVRMPALPPKSVKRISQRIRSKYQRPLPALPAVGQSGGVVGGICIDHDEKEMEKEIKVMEDKGEGGRTSDN